MFINFSTLLITWVALFVFKIKIREKRSMCNLSSVDYTLRSLATTVSNVQLLMRAKKRKKSMTPLINFELIVVVESCTMPGVSHDETGAIVMHAPFSTTNKKVRRLSQRCGAVQKRSCQGCCPVARRSAQLIFVTVPRDPNDISNKNSLRIKLFYVSKILTRGCSLPS